MQKFRLSRRQARPLILISAKMWSPHPNFIKARRIVCSNQKCLLKLFPGFCEKCVFVQRHRQGELLPGRTQCASDGFNEVPGDAAPADLFSCSLRLSHFNTQSDMLNL